MSKYNEYDVVRDGVSKSALERKAKVKADGKARRNGRARKAYGGSAHA